MVERNTRGPRYWHNPPMTTIHLLSGQEAQAHVNGKTPDGLYGHVFADGHEMEVRLIDKAWCEVGEDIEFLEEDGSLP